MKLSIEPESRIPIYIQVEEQIRSLIAAGQLRPGDQLPTIRELATDLRVNYNTIARAYLDLDRDSIISTQRGRGTFVAGVPGEEQAAQARRQEKLRSILRAALEGSRRLGYSVDEVAAAFHRELTQWMQENGQK